MRYHWLKCAGCGCEVAINTSRSSSGLSGSVRRWNTERTINDGKRFQISDPPGDGTFSVECVCGQRLDLSARPDATGAEREAPMRVTLGS